MMGTDNTFKRKFNFILLGSVTLLLLLGAVISLAISSIRKNVEKTHKVSEISANITRCQSLTKSFILNAWSDTMFVRTGSNQEIEQFGMYVKKVNDNFLDLRAISDAEEQKTIEEEEKGFLRFQENFRKVASLIRERGFKNAGLEGKLREAAHKLEKAALLSDKALVLVLRKHEKDFFLRRDPSYLKKFEKDAAVLQESLSALAESPEKSTLLQAFQTYTATFHKIAALEAQIGLTRTEGLRGEIELLIEKSVKNFDAMNLTYSDKTRNLIATVTTFIFVIFIVILVVVYVGLNKLIKPVFEPMQEIQMKASEISEGNLSVQFGNLRDNKILKELIESFEKIIYKFRTTMSQVEGISARKILTDLPVHSDKDEVGITLNKIIAEIKRIDEEDKRRGWHNEGLAHFANILRKYNNDEAAMYDNIVSEFVRYLNALQGALFVIEGEEQKDLHLRMKGCYAYNRKKFADTITPYSAT